MSLRIINRSIVPTLAEVDILVVGAGSAGCVAALAAKKSKAHSVILLERYGFAASGDADLCHAADIPYEKAGEQEPAQTLATTFRMSNVDLDAFDEAGGKQNLMRLMDNALENGTHPLPRKSGSAHRMVPKGCIATVAVRVADMDATNFEALSEAEIEGRRQAFVFEDFFRDCVPGYGDSHIIGLSHQIGVRETRRVYGEYRLTKSDCLEARQFSDTVLMCGAPIEDHRKSADGNDETHWEYVPEGSAYGVPYRSLVARGRDDLWVAGRCFSATHGAHASCRSMAQTMAMGQAAGAVASLSLLEDLGDRNIDTTTLIALLKTWGSVLEMPYNIAHTAKADWRKNILME